MAKFIIAGAGLSGLSVANMLQDRGHDVEVYETRSCPGGLCRDMFVELETKEILRVHPFGGHIFHTNNERVWKWVNKWNRWSRHDHRVVACTKAGFLPVPINRQTIKLVGSEERAIELICQSYTEKMWGIPWTFLPDEVKNRIAIRDDYNDLYFTDKFVALPINGYASLFDRMAENLDVRYDCKNTEWLWDWADAYIYTGRLDELHWAKRQGLRWHTLDFEWSESSTRKHKVINDCLNGSEYIRSIDHSLWNPGLPDTTLISKEIARPCGEDDLALYPMPFEKDQNIAKQIKENIPPNIHLLGRLAEYKYKNMDECVADAFELAERIG